MPRSIVNTAITCFVICGVLSSAGCMPKGFLIIPVSPDRNVVETELIHEGWLAPKIAVIDLDGIIVNAASSGLVCDGEHPVSMLVEKLDEAADDRDVKAVILRINSPGGAVAASEYMHGEIERFRAESGKPVVAAMMDVAASGGFYVACACDEIWAHRSTVTGSIGVIMQLFDVTGTMAKIGVTPTTIKSSDLKGGGSPFEKLNERDRAIFQGIINEMYEEFVQVVADGRPKLAEDRVRELADGRVFTARQALDAGLIDHIGSFRDVIERTKELAGVRRANVVAYGRPHAHLPNYYARSPVEATVNIVNVELPRWLRGGGARFMYLWAP